MNDELENDDSYNDKHGLTLLEIQQISKDNEKVKLEAVLDEVGKIATYDIDCQDGAFVSNLVAKVSKLTVLYNDYMAYCQTNMEM